MSSVSAFFQSSLRSSLQKTDTPATDSPDTRFSVMAAVVLSGCLCQSRKDPYLPLDPQYVRLLPRPTGLPPMAFVASFRLCFADAKTVPKHHRPTHIRPLEPHHSPPSSPARGAFLGFIFSFGTDLIRSFFVTYVLKSCRAGYLLIVWFACSGSRLCGQ